MGKVLHLTRICFNFSTFFGEWIRIKRNNQLLASNCAQNQTYWLPLVLIHILARFPSHNPYFMRKQSGKKKGKKAIFLLLVKLILPRRSTSSESPNNTLDEILYLNYYSSSTTPSSILFDDWIQKSLTINITYWSTKRKISQLSRDSFVQHWGSKSLIIRKLQMCHLFMLFKRMSHYAFYCSLRSPKTAFSTRVSFSRRSCKLPKFSQERQKFLDNQQITRLCHKTSFIPKALKNEPWPVFISYIC